MQQLIYALLEARLIWKIHIMQVTVDTTRILNITKQILSYQKLRPALQSSLTIANKTIRQLSRKGAAKMSCLRLRVCMHSRQSRQITFT